MRGVMTEVPEFVLEHRRKTGADRWDEMWDGVLHMTPMPNTEHQDFEYQLEHWLRTWWGLPFGNRVYHQINVASIGGWPRNYRIPNLVMLTPDQFSIDKSTHFEGAPLVAIEIHSPDDESYEKLEFYAGIGVQEVWVIHRDTRRPEIYVLDGDEYYVVESDSAGWLISPGTSIGLKPKRPRKLAIQYRENVASLALLPHLPANRSGG